MSVQLIRELWEYHHWANRRLFDVAAALGEEVLGREIGTQFSEPSLRRMFTHLYGADALWLQRWKGDAAARSPGADITAFAELRHRWDELIAQQRGFIAGVGEADLGRPFDVKGPDGVVTPRPFGMMLLHVANHATHHRSEIATMLTIVTGSPPDTGINTYYRQKGSAAPS